jgi:radical SAM superfamily enzyme YgiQ (UPF0313 family)
MGAADVPKALSVDKVAPPYTAIHLASLLPKDWEITIVHEMLRDVDRNMDVDAVFLSTMDYCAPHAYKLAQEFHVRGAKVIIGGLYPTINPEYFREVADAIVIGEAEGVMQRLVADLERNKLSRIYKSTTPVDMSKLPVPRYDLVETDFSITMVYEATRGCPFQCSFCILSALRSPYRRRPIPNVVRDLRAIPSWWSWSQRKYVGFYDNNLGADRSYFRELCTALIPLKRIWGVETSIDTITPDMARMMGKAGARFAYIGLESLSQSSLKGLNKHHNKVSEYRQKIQYLHENGVIVMSIFLLGLDEDSLEDMYNLPDLVLDIGVDVPVFTFVVPIQGTPFHKYLQDTGRLISGDILNGMDGATLLYEPKNMSREEVEFGVFQCMQRTYTPWRIASRILTRVKNNPWVTLSLISSNLFYMQHQNAIARCGLAKLETRLCDKPPPCNVRRRNTALGDTC